MARITRKTANTEAATAATEEEAAPAVDQTTEAPTEQEAEVSEQEEAGSENNAAPDEAAAPEAAPGEMVVSRNGRGVLKPVNDPEVKELAFDIVHGKVDGKTKYRATVDGSDGGTVTTIKGALSGAMDAATLDKGLYDIEGAAKAIDWVGVGHNGPTEPTDWNEGVNAKRLQELQGEAASAIELVSNGEQTVRQANRKLGKIVAEVRGMIQNDKLFGKWVKDAGEKVSKRLDGNKNTAGELAFMGTLPESLFDLVPSNLTSPKAVEAWFASLRNEVAELLAQSAFQGTGGKAPSVTLVNKLLRDEGASALTDKEAVQAGINAKLTTKEAQLGRMARNEFMALNYAHFSGDDANLQLVQFNKTDHRFEECLDNKGNPVLPALFKTGKAGKGNELIAQYVKALNFELSKEARETEAKAKEERASEEKAIVEAVRGFDKFQVSEAALHLFKILACRLATEEKEGDADDVFNAVGEMIDRYDAGETVEQIEADVKAKMTAEQTQEAEQQAEGDAEDAA